MFSYSIKFIYFTVNVQRSHYCSLLKILTKSLLAIHLPPTVFTLPFNVHTHTPVFMTIQFEVIAIYCLRSRPVRRCTNGWMIIKMLFFVIVKFTWKSSTNGMDLIITPSHSYTKILKIDAIKFNHFSLGKIAELK